MQVVSPFPQSDIDLFSDDTLRNTKARYQVLRDLGPVVYLPKNDLYAFTHFDAVRAALRADKVLINGKGVAANHIVNNSPALGTLASDGDVHMRRRNLVLKPLTPHALKAVKDRIETSADQLIQDLVARDKFCGVADFATHLPITIVAELVGLEDSARENMLNWAAAVFDSGGPLNNRTLTALDTVRELFKYIRGLNLERLRPGSWAYDIYQSLDAGEISQDEAMGMVLDYTGPSLDTTILASAHMLWRIGKTPGVWDKLRTTPELIPSAVNESVRLSSPIREFTRFVEQDYAVDGKVIPAGSRAVILYASANWDNRQYSDAAQFKLERNPKNHVGWGHGPHVCAGMHLARLEMEALIKAMVKHVGDLMIGEPEPILNNVLQGFKTLPAKFFPND